MKSNRHAFPETFAKIRTCKAEGLPALRVWEALKTGVKNSGMRPSEQAMSLAEYQTYIIEVYGNEGRKAVQA